MSSASLTACLEWTPVCVWKPWNALRSHVRVGGGPESSLSMTVWSVGRQALGVFLGDSSEHGVCCLHPAMASGLIEP